MRSFVRVLSAALLATACSSCGIADGASNSTTGKAGSAAARATAPGQVVPETLSAATVAAQANVDRFSSGDFAGVWELMSREVRDGITQHDFVTFYETCKKAGPKIRVAGVRLDAANGEAIIRMEVAGTERPRIMLFERGQLGHEAHRRVRSASRGADRADRRRREVRGPLLQLIISGTT
jgi:hypothetical protein